MPGVVVGGSPTMKRKRAEEEKKFVRRLRPESEEEDPREHILLLETEIFESKKNYNNIAKLITFLDIKNSQVEFKIIAAITLCRVFTRLAAAGDLSRGQLTTEKDDVVLLWLKERYSEYKNELLQLLAIEEFASTVLTLLMRTLKSEGTHLRVGQGYSFPTPFLKLIVHTLLNVATGDFIRSEFSQKYVEEYDDIRFYTFRVLEKLLDENLQPSSRFVENSVQIMSAIESVPENREELEDFYVSEPQKSTHDLYSLNAHKKQAQAAWLAILKLDMDKEQRKFILGIMTTSIAPWFLKPELLMDFLTDSYNAGGSTSLLALSGLFYLIEKMNLDYPLFYQKLYSLLDGSILHSKHRSKFLRLLNTFMSSTHLPAVLVASFIKRLSRLLLNAPPAAIVAVIPWIYNLLKKHPTCTFMIHREAIGNETETQLKDEGMDDPFDEFEENPMETRAIESSLWEIVTLQSHYHPNVATLANIISEQFTKHAYNLEDFLDHSYGSMLDAELGKDVKKVPVVEYEIPKRILLSHEAGSEVEDSLLVKLWDFTQGHMD